MLKKILIGSLLFLIIPIVAFASTFNSQQVGGSATNGFVLQTNGSNSTWVSTTTLGFAGSQTITLSGDITGSGATSISTTLSTVNGNVGSFGGATSIPTFTVNAKGLITAAGAVTPSIPVGDITGVLPIANGGTASSTALGGILKGNGSSAVSSAIAGTDYQAPITLTTTGSSGAATFSANTLNIPQYSGGTAGVQLPTYVVAASGGNFTTIQGALDACGTAGGGNIVLTDKTYSIGSTGLLWKGSNCVLSGRGPGTTTVAFTGATTAIKTNSAAGQYTHDEIHNIFFSGPANTTSVAIDWSNMTHGIVDNVQTSAVGTSLLLNDTQNITFYNSFTNLDFNDNHLFCINASSTNPVNANLFSNIFCGDATTANVIGVQMDNANGNMFNLIDIEPGTLIGTVGLKIFDNKLATNNGVFNNILNGLYIEANGIGVSIATTINPTAGGIQRNTLSGVTSEANTTDWSLTQAAIALNNINGYDSNFGAPLTTFQGPMGIGTSSELLSISATPYAYFGVNASSTVATNELVVDNNTSGATYRTDLLVNSIGYLGLNTTNPTSRLTVADLTSADAIVPTVSFTGDTNFAKTAQILKVSNNNASDSGTTTQITNIGTGPSFEVEDQANDPTPFVIDASGNTGIGSTTPFAKLAVVGRTDSTSGFYNSGIFFGMATGTLTSNSYIIGSVSLPASYSGVDNFFVGSGAGKNTTAGSQNDFIGNSAGLANTSGNNNDFIGFNAAQSMSSGNSNVIVGSIAGANISTGGGDTALGEDALAAGSVGSNISGSTAIGFQSGSGMVSSATNNTFIGEGTKVTVDTGGTNMTAIGAGATVSASNSLVLGNNASVGVGTSSPWRTLSVNGTVAMKGLTAAAGNAICISTVTFEITTASGTSCVSSSEYTKHDIESIPFNATDEVMDLNPVQYLYNTTEDARYGFVAENVAKIDPKLVIYADQDTFVTQEDGSIHTIKKGEPYSFDYERYTALLTKSLQEQVRRIDSLASGGRRTAEENWQWVVMGILALGFIGQQIQISRLKKK